MNKRLTLLFGVSALAVLFTAAPVMAADFDTTGENLTTGADSDNENEFEIDTEVEVEVENEAEVDNEADVDADTGDNEVEENTNAGDLETGTVDVTGIWENTANAGASLLGADDGGLTGSADFMNDTTGADSDNENELDVDHEVELELENTADFWNELDFDADTGDNEVEENTNVGNTTTGSGMLDIMVGNWANNDSGFSGSDLGWLDLDLTGENNTTGADSDNENEFDIDSDVDVEIENEAEVDNEFDVDIDTGGNDVEKNTNAGDLTTGNGDVKIETENRVNNGGSALGAGSGGLNLKAEFVNDTTGANSDNENELDVDHEVDVEIENEAEVNNEADVDIDTGDNDVERNTNVGHTRTGDATIELNFFNEVNS